MKAREKEGSKTEQERASRDGESKRKRERHNERKRARERGTIENKNLGDLGAQEVCQKVSKVSPIVESYSISIVVFIFHRELTFENFCLPAFAALKGGRIAWGNPEKEMPFFPSSEMLFCVSVSNCIVVYTNKHTHRHASTYSRVRAHSHT